MHFKGPQAFSSALTALGTLQPQAFGPLKCIETSNSSSNYYLEFTCRECCNLIGYLVVLYFTYRPPKKSISEI